MGTLRYAFGKRVARLADAKKNASLLQSWSGWPSFFRSFGFVDCLDLVTRCCVSSKPNEIVNLLFSVRSACSRNALQRVGWEKAEAQHILCLYHHKSVEANCSSNWTWNVSLDSIISTLNWNCLKPRWSAWPRLLFQETHAKHQASNAARSDCFGTAQVAMGCLLQLGQCQVQPTFRTPRQPSGTWAANTSQQGSRLLLAIV